jgi:UDP-N-acetylglucosamine--dolichyl-phosphate N-acetylglucosaminephosphotransferase
MTWLEILLVILHFVLAFVVCFFLTKWWIKTAKSHKSMMQPDMNKYNKKILVPKTGGIVIAISFVVSIFIYIFFKTFILNSPIHTIEILTIVITLLLACFIAFIDDIFGWEKSSISGYKKILMTIPIAVPLMIINAGHSIVNLPFFGEVSLGILYPLVLIPLLIVGTTNGFNMLAGFNGLESGLGIIIMSTLGFISLITGQKWLALIAGIIVFILIAFYLFNKVPAKIFPGNTLTYIVGAMIGCFAIIGNMEKSAFILFIPFIIEGFLKLRSKFKAHNFGVPNKDNSLEPRYPKIYSLTHFALRFLKKIKPSHKVYEKDIVYFIFLIEIILVIVVILNTFLHFI